MKWYLLNLKIFNVWVYKELSKFPVTIERRYKKVIEAPHQIAVEKSSTIEGIFKEILKRLFHDPDKLQSKSPVIVEADKFILIIFYQRALKDSQKFPLLLKEH